jgi:DNA-binding IclR family transcriptional regulator
LSRAQPLERALIVLATISRSRVPPTISEVATRSGLPVATVHRLISQLEPLGMVRRALGSKRLMVGAGLLDLGRAALESSMVADAPHRILIGLAGQIGEHCQIGVCEDGEVLYVDSARATRSEGLHFDPGRRSPLHCTSIGKLYLAEMPDSALRHWIANTPLASPTTRSVTQGDDLLRMIARVRAEGWAASNEEYAPGVVGCAVPIRGADGSLIAGLGISAPSARVGFGDLPQFRPPLERAAQAIGQVILE